MALVKLLVLIIVFGTVLISLLLLPMYFYRRKKNPDNEKNTIKRLICVSFLGVAVATGMFTIFIISFGRALIEKENNSITVTGGADGPTAVFVADKIGDGIIGWTGDIEK